MKQSFMPVMLQLFYTDLIFIKQTFVTRLNNLFIWTGAMAFVAGYLLPSFGSDAHYGAFMMAGIWTTIGRFETKPGAALLVADFNGDQKIMYDATLPIPAYWIFLRFFIRHTFATLLLALPIIPFLKLVLWNRFDLSHMSFAKYVIAMGISSLFFGAFTLWLASHAKTVFRVSGFWIRVVVPLWFVGGSNANWFVLYERMPAMAYVNLLNPFVYLTEMGRVSLLGPKGYLHFWLCVAVLLTMAIMFLIIGIKRLKKRLDFV